MAINTAAISGNLGRDAELRTTGASAVVSFSVAVKSRAKVDGEWTEKTNWVPCVMFGKYAEAMHPHLTKGKRVSVAGKLNENKWTDKDGNDRSRLELIVDSVEILEPRPPKDKDFRRAEPVQSPGLCDEDIPF